MSTPDAPKSTTANTSPALYKAYIAAINAQDWATVESFVNDTVTHNSTRLSKQEYCNLMISAFEACPDFTFSIDRLVVNEEAGDVACRIMLEGTPVKAFLGFGGTEGEGRKVRFAEHVFYAWEGGRIVRVWSLLDLEQVKKQLGG